MEITSEELQMIAMWAKSTDKFSRWYIRALLIDLVDGNIT